MTAKYNLAQGNFSYILGESLDDPIMHEFTSNLASINAIADQSPGFIWRLQDDSNKRVV